MRKLTKEELTEFLMTVEKAEGDVFLKSVEGDCFNITSSFCRYVSVMQLLEKRAEELELYCEKKSDEALFRKFL